MSESYGFLGETVYFILYSVQYGLQNPKAANDEFRPDVDTRETFSGEFLLKD